MYMSYTYMNNTRELYDIGITASISGVCTLLYIDRINITQMATQNHGVEQFTWNNPRNVVLTMIFSSIQSSETYRIVLSSIHFRTSDTIINCF